MSDDAMDVNEMPEASDKQTLKARAGELAKIGVIRGSKGTGRLALRTIMASGRGAKVGFQLAKKMAGTKFAGALNVGDYIEEGQVLQNRAAMNERGIQELTVTGANGTMIVRKKARERVKVLTTAQVGKLAVDYKG